MNGRDLSDMLWLTIVAEEHSFTKAAARLGTAQSTLSLAIKKLEERMGVRLLTRTTRSVSPTEAGERLIATLATNLGGIEETMQALVASRDRPSGAVRITTSDHAYYSAIAPKLGPVLGAYPEITIELNLDNGFRNIVEERFDAGVRLGESLDKDMIAVRIGPDWRMIVVGAPHYFDHHPAPLVPQDLMQHSCMNYRQRTDATRYAWEFEKAGRQLRVKVDGQLTFNTSYAMVEAALRGQGVCFVAEDTVTDHLAAGRLVQVLDDWCPFFSGYYLYYPSRRQNSAAFKILVDALRE